MTLADQIAETETAIKPLMEQLAYLRRQKREQDSREFIRVNNITLDDVELSDGIGKPYFGMISGFIDWIRENDCQKRWAEWNTRIYHTSDLLANRMSETPALINHLPGVEK